jgi:hypothetical protein
MLFLLLLLLVVVVVCSLFHIVHSRSAPAVPVRLLLLPCAVPIRLPIVQLRVLRVLLLLPLACSAQHPPV